MSDQFGDQFGTTPALGTADVQMARQSFLTSVFGWMFVGLAITAGVAAYVAASSNMLDWVNDHPWAWLGLFAVQIGLVVAISAGINKISGSVAVFLFALYAAVTGFVSVVAVALTTNRLETLPFENARPVYPLDDIEWGADEA